MTVTDNDGVELATERAANDGAAARIENVSAERSGQLFAAVETGSLDPPTAYTLQLVEDGSAVEAAGATSVTPAARSEEAGKDEGAPGRAVTSGVDAADVSESGFLGILFIGLLMLAVILALAILLRRRVAGFSTSKSTGQTAREAQ